MTAPTLTHSIIVKKLAPRKKVPLRPVVSDPERKRGQSRNSNKFPVLELPPLPTHASPHPTQDQCSNLSLYSTFSIPSMLTPSQTFSDASPEEIVGTGDFDCFPCPNSGSPSHLPTCWRLVVLGCAIELEIWVDVTDGDLSELSAE